MNDHVSAVSRQRHVVVQHLQCVGADVRRSALQMRNKPFHENLACSNPDGIQSMCINLSGWRDMFPIQNMRGPTLRDGLKNRPTPISAGQLLRDTIHPLNEGLGLRTIVKTIQNSSQA